MSVSHTRNLVFIVAGVLLAVGCGRRYYREQADRETYAILTERTAGTPWSLEPGFAIEPDPRSRLFDPSDPVDPVLPVPGPRLYEYRMPELNGRVARGPQPEDPPPASGSDSTAFAAALGSPQPPENSAPSSTLSDGRERRPDARNVRLTAFQVPQELPSEKAEPDDPSPSAGDGSQEEVGLPVQPIPESYWEALPRQCLWRMFESESVRGEYRRQYGSEPEAELRDPSRRLSLEEIFHLARLNSREYQSQKEQLYLAALDVTLERFDYSIKFTPTGNGADVDYTHSRAGGETVQSLGVGSAIAVDRMLNTGGTFLARFANNLVLTFDGPEGWATDIGSELFFELNQSLFQRDRQLESLVQSERDLVYEARDFARFRKEFFVALAARYYNLLQNYRSIEIESQNYFSLIRTYEQAKAEERAGVKKAPNPVAVDQFEQSMLSGRSGLISSCNRLEQNLDSLKVAMGLPTETPINIDLSELDELTLRDEVEVAAERVRRWRDLVLDRRNRPNPDRSDILNGDIFLIERILHWLRMRERLGEHLSDAPELQSLLDKLRVSAMRVEVERNRLELQRAQDPTAGAPVILLYARTSDLIEALLGLARRQIELAERLGRDREATGAARRRLQGLRQQLEDQREKLDEVLQDSEQKGLEDLLDDAARQLLRELQRLVGSLDGMIGTLPDDQGSEADKLKQTLAQTDHLVEITEALLKSAPSGLHPVAIGMDDAMATALVQRFDLMNERGRLADLWRGIKLAADELKSVLNFNADYSLGTPDNKPVKFSSDNSRARVAVAFDLPLNRQEKRNAFRRALVDYQAGLRRWMALEDSIKFSVRDGLRILNETRIQYPISVAQAALAAEQVISVRLQLALGVQGVRGTDLLDAQESSRRALISVADARIGYLVDRAELALELELLELDKSGVWPQINDAEYQLAPDLDFPEGAGPTYGDLPRMAWVSREIRRMLDYPLPGQSPAETAGEPGAVDIATRVREEERRSSARLASTATEGRMRAR